MGSIPEVRLGSTNVTILVVGFGTAAWPFGASETMKESILNALKLGYRHFDAAALYHSEQTLGEAIAQALQLGLIQSRTELFITSKLWCSDAHTDRVLPALQKTLQKLGLDYLDLYLIHFPIFLKSEGYETTFNNKDLLPMDFKAVWEAMEECHRLGLAKHIGVSNFSCQKIQQLLLTSKILPAVNQVEVNPVWQQKKLREFCEKKGIHVTAYSPLGASGTRWGNNRVMDCETLKEIADTKGKTVAQVCLRWVYEQGVSVLVKSFNKERIKENLDIFDWMLSPEESQKIDRIPQQKGCLGLQFISDQGPYQSVEEIWDEEIITLREVANSYMFGEAESVTLLHSFPNSLEVHGKKILIIESRFIALGLQEDWKVNEDPEINDRDIWPLWDSTMQPLRCFFKRSSLHSTMDCRFSFDQGPENPPTSVIFGPEYMATNVYQHCQTEDLELAKTLVRPNGMFFDDVAKESLLTEARYGSVSRVYIVCKEDQLMKPEFQRWIIQNNPPDEVKSIANADHMIILSKPKELCLCLQEISQKYH
ncbi:unnamed protein product [Camellia sinensis]